MLSNALLASGSRPAARGTREYTTANRGAGEVLGSSSVWDPSLVSSYMYSCSHPPVILAPGDPAVQQPLLASEGSCIGDRRRIVCARGAAGDACVRVVFILITTLLWMASSGIACIWTPGARGSVLRTLGGTLHVCEKTVMTRSVVQKASSTPSPC